MAKKKKDTSPTDWLPSEVAEKFKVINWTGSHRQRSGKFGTIDLKAMTLERAEQLVKMKFPFLEEVSSKKSNPTTVPEIPPTT